MLMASLALASTSSAQSAPDSLTLSRRDVTERAIAAAADLEHFQAAVRAASSLTRIPALVSSPVLTVESEGSPSPFSGSEYTRRLSLDQEIDFRGQKGARRLVGQASVAVAERDLASREQIIVAAVDEAYGRWLVARRRLEFVSPLVERSQELTGRAEVARRREIVTGFDVRVLKGDLAELASEQIEAQRELEQADAELKVWTGMPADQPIRLVDDLDRDQWRCSVDSLTVLARHARADLERAVAAESLAVTRVGLEQRLALANPSLGISAGRERQSFESPTGALVDQETFVGIHASIPLPFARSSIGVSEAQLEVARTRAERAGLDRTVRQDVAAACAGMARAEARRALLRDAGSSAASDLILTESAYREGRIPLEQYLTVRERLVRIQREALDGAAAVEEARARRARTVNESTEHRH